MKITEVKIRKIIHEGKVKAIVSIVIDNVFAVHDMKIIERPEDKSLFIAMPYRKNAQNKQLDIAHPIDAQTRQYIEQEILQEYRRACEQAEDQPQEESSDLIVPEAAAEPAEASLAYIRSEQSLCDYGYNKSTLALS